MRIGVCSPGLGFLSLSTCIATQFSPKELVLFCDNANAPYGNRDPADTRLLVQAMLESSALRSCDMVIVSCNTSSLHLPSLSTPRPTLGMIEPTISGIRQCLTQSDSVLLLGTSATIQAGFYERAVSETGAKVCAIAISELASAIDSGDIRAQTRAIEQHIDARVAGCSAALLLCTHFPLAADLISARLREVVGQPVVILSQDQWVCEYLKEKEIHSGIDTVAVTLVLTAPSSSIELQVRRRFPGSNVQAVLA